MDISFIREEDRTGYARVRRFGDIAVYVLSFVALRSRHADSSCELRTSLAVGA